MKVGTAVAGAGARNELAQSLRPLGFGAAYKVLDLLVEHVLRANGEYRRRFEEKIDALAVRPAQLPIPLASVPEIWDRLAKLYERFNDPRHAVTHRRAWATVGGDLEIFDNDRQLTDTVSSAEIQSFAAAVHASAELVIEQSNDQDRLNIVAWHVNQLASRHALPELKATDPSIGRRRLDMDLINLENGRLQIDLALAKETVEGQTPSPWDIRLYAGERVFVGRWDDVPDREQGRPIDFDSDSPPAWLSEELDPSYG